MQQGKQVKTYKRRTKSGKTITVKAHTRSRKRKLKRPIGGGSLGPETKKK